MSQLSRPPRAGITPRAVLLLLPLILILGTAAQPSSGVSHTAPEARAAAIDGAWEGVMQIWPELMHVRLDLRVDSGRITGEAQLRPLVQSRSAVRPFAGRARVVGTYDAWSGGFSVAAAEWIESPPGSTRRLQLDGVHDARGDALGGVVTPYGMDGSPYFALGRPGSAQRAILDPARRATQARHVNPPNMGVPNVSDRRSAAIAIAGAIFGAARDNGKDVDLREWAQPLRTEYPQLDLNNTALGSVFLVARNLFADEYFEPRFGKRFEAMGDAERTRHHLELSSELGKDKPLATELGALAGGFSHINAPDMVVSVLGQRIVRAWRNDLVARLGVMPAASEAFEQIAAAERTSARALQLVWPSEREAVKTTIDATRTRIAFPVLSQSATDAIGQAAGLAGVQRLVSWKVENEEALGWLSEEQRTGLFADIDARMDQLLEPLVVAEVAKLAQLGTGMAAVNAGNAWLRELVHRYGFALERAAVQGAVAQLRERRAADLAAARAEIARQIAAQTAVEDVDGLLRTTLAVPGDASTTTGVALVAAAQDRKRAIGWAERLRYFSPSERRYADAATGRLVIPAGVKLRPDSNDIRIAVLRAFVDASGRWIDANTVGYGFAPFMGALDFAITVDAVHVGNGGYVCDASANEVTPYFDECGETLEIRSGFEAMFDVHISVALTREADGFFRAFGGRGGENAMTAVFDAMLKLEGPRKITHQIVLTQDGWQSPTLTAQLRLNNLSAFRDALMPRR